MFWLALKTGFWTILTLGIYRFWMKTRLRRFYWSAIRPGGHPMEYTGDPFEKLLGFFIAVVILTFYIGVVNLLLMFVSFSVFEGQGAGYLASVAGVIPLWFYARYRARRYVLGRTRWRGVRFALEPAAWKYTGQALKHWAITLLTLGVLWPRMTFLLEKFRTDRTLFGDVRLEQGGRWQMLIPATYPFVAALLFAGLWALWVLRIDPMIDPAAEMNLAALLRGDVDLEQALSLNKAERLWVLPVLLIGLFYGAVHYASVSKRIMANHKKAGGVTLTSTLSPLRIFMIYNLGYSLSYIVLLLGVIGLMLMAIPMLGLGGVMDVFGPASQTDPTVPRWLSVPILILVYFTVFLMWSVCHNVFVTFPLMRHRTRTLAMGKTSGLSRISQRRRDQFAEAEGFAEALDLGAAI